MREDGPRESSAPAAPPASPVKSKRRKRRLLWIGLPVAFVLLFIGCFEAPHNLLSGSANHSPAHDSSLDVVMETRSVSFLMA